MINFLNIQYFGTLLKINLLHLCFLDFHIGYFHFDIQSRAGFVLVFVLLAYNYLPPPSLPISLPPSPTSFFFLSLCLSFPALSLPPSSLFMPGGTGRRKSTHTQLSDALLACLKHIANPVFI